MTLRVGYHFQEDSYAGPAIGAATFLDVGGSGAADWAAERMCRLYFTGQPPADELAAAADEWARRGNRVVIGNEPNLAEVEQFPGGPADFAAFFADVADRVASDTRLYYAGMSPGVPGWEAWYTDPAARAAIDSAAGLCVHAYGDLPQLQQTVAWVRSQFPGKLLWIGEYNWGAGRWIDDVDTWVGANVPAFLDWLASDPLIEAATWFAWRWDQSSTLPTSVDAAGTVIEDVIASWVPPMNGGAGETWYEGATRRPISVNYTPGRGGHAPVVLVDHVADGLGSPYGWFNTDRGASGSSSTFWVSRGGAVEQYRPLEDTTWANGILDQPDMTSAAVAAIVASGVDPNAVSVSIETEGFPGDVFPEAQVAASRALHQWLSGVLGIPLTRERVLAHAQFDSVNRPYCPGPTFPWEEVMGTAPPAFDINAVRDQVWRLAGECELNGWPWYGQSLKAATSLSKQEH